MPFSDFRAALQYAVRLNETGLPMRPGEPVCSFFAKSGACKFGPSCKVLTHPPPPLPPLPARVCVPKLQILSSCIHNGNITCFEACLCCFVACCVNHADLTTGMCCNHSSTTHRGGMAEPTAAAAGGHKSPPHLMSPQT